MELDQVSAQLIDPAMALLPPVMDTPQARLMLLAIGLQESKFERLHQIKGPAHGYWQFERGGGTRGVMQHRASQRHARELVAAADVPWTLGAVFEALDEGEHQVLACGFARLLLWTDPHPLPQMHDIDGAWDYYIRTWRPGKPHPETWAGFHQQAAACVG